MCRNQQAVLHQQFPASKSLQIAGVLGHLWLLHELDHLLLAAGVNFFLSLPPDVLYLSVAWVVEVEVLIEHLTMTLYAGLMVFVSSSKIAARSS